MNETFVRQEIESTEFRSIFFVQIEIQLMDQLILERSTQIEERREGISLTKVCDQLLK